MSLLSRDLQTQVFAAFKGRLLKGVIRQKVVDVSAGLDERGEVIDAAYVDTPIEGFVDNYSDYFKANGIPQTDVKVCFFGGSCPDITPGKDDLVMLDGIGGPRWYLLRGPNQTDPATALWTCQGVPTKTPS